MITVTIDNFEQEVLNAEKPVLVDFFAEWCPPCKALAPILEKIAEEREEDIKIVKVDVDASQELAAQYGIRSMPTLLMIRDGDVIAQKVGGAQKSAMNEWIDRAIALPEGTKFEATVLSEEQKSIVAEAFRKAVNAMADGDEPSGRKNAEGKELTKKELQLAMLEAGMPQRRVANTMDETGETFEDVLAKISAPKPK